MREKMTLDDWRQAIQNDCLPDIVTADDILDLGEEFVHNAVFRYGMVYIIMVNGWYYKGEEGEDCFRLCNAIEKLDPVMFHY